MRRMTTVSTGILFALAIVLPATAQNPKRDRATMRSDAAAAGIRVTPGRLGGRAPQGIGTIQYDPGSPFDVRSADPPFAFIGNLFDTQSGVPLSPGTIYAVSWYQGPISAKGYGTLMVVPSVSGTPQLISIDPVQSYTTNLVSFTPISVNPPFFAGLDAVEPQAQFRGQGQFAQIGYATQSVNSQGFHGSQRTFSGGGGTLRAPITNQNLLVRSIGNVAIPVELMEFEVE